MYYKRRLISIYKTVFYFERTLVQLSTLLLSQHHYVHLVLSYKHRLYLNLFLKRPSPLPLSIAYSVQLVVEPSLSCLDADCPLPQYLGLYHIGLAFISPYTILTIFSAFATIHAHILLSNITL